MISPGYYNGDIKKHINNISGARWGLGLLSVPGGEHKAVSTSGGICSDDQRCWIQVLNLIYKYITMFDCFRFVDFENLTFGVAAVHSGFKL